MKFNFRNIDIRTSFAFHLGVVLAIAMLLYITFFVTLHCATHHGREVLIPNLKGKDVNYSVSQLKNLHFEVQVDSTYEIAFKPLTVLRQIPDSGSVVKEGRTVFLTVNRVLPPFVPMPNLLSISYRSAEMLLRNSKLLVGDTILKPDIAAGAVLEQMYKGQPIRPGDMIAMGSKITLVIGNGMGNTQFDVPEVIRIPVDEAITRLYAYNIQPRIIAKDGSDISDTSSAYVVCQYPKAQNETGGANRINMGDFMELIIVQNPTEADYQGCSAPAPPPPGNTPPPATVK
jgi:eukaryotic-like serine/threonine-protein kinase